MGKTMDVLLDKHIELFRKVATELAIKVMKEKGAKEATSIHVKAFVKIVRKYCEEIGKTVMFRAVSPSTY